jgi:hypothetical protein
MSDLTFPPVEPEDREPEIPMWLVLGLVVVMIAAAGLAAFVLLNQKDDKEAAASYPKEWDARILPYVKIVQKERGLTFLHPVAVRFLDDKAFEKTVRTDQSELSKDDRKQLEQMTGVMRALGLLSGDVDLFDAFNDAYGSGTLAYYSFDDQRVTVRGQKVTPAMRSTLVHELTHALQDQRFAIGKLQKRLDKQVKDDKDTTSESSVVDAIVEGDARRVESLYRDSLSPKKRRALDKSTQDQYDAAIGKLKKVPKVILTLVSSPYTFGEGLTEAVAGDGGNAAVDGLFRDPPTHDDVLLDPYRLLAGDTHAAHVALPELASGEKRFDGGEFGAVTWYFMLAERMPIVDALSAVDGWDGDSYVAFERNGVSCIRAEYAGRNDAATGTMYRALQTWTAGGPTKAASVTRDAGRIRFESCDPGTKVKVGRDASEDALNLAAVRIGVGIGIVKAGLPAPAARCVANKMVREYPISTLTSSATPSAAVQARIRQIVQECR